MVFDSSALSEFFVKQASTKTAPTWPEVEGLSLNRAVRPSSRTYRTLTLMMMTLVMSVVQELVLKKNSSYVRTRRLMLTQPNSCMLMCWTHPLVKAVARVFVTL